MASVKKLHYRLADSIRFNNVGVPSEGLSKKYYEMHPHKGLKHVDAPIHFESVNRIFMDSGYKTAPENSILFHFRLFDWLSWPYAGKIIMKDCQEFVDSKVDIIKSVNTVCIVYGGGNNEQMS